MRVANRIASVLLGLLLIAAGLMAAVEAVLALASRPPVLPLRDWYQRLTSTTYADNAVRLVSIGLIVLGLIVLLTQLRRWRPRELDLSPEEKHEHFRIQRRSLEEQVSQAVNDLPGVHDAEAMARGGERRWRLRVRARARRDQLEQIRSTARRAMDMLSVPSGVPVAVDVREPRRVA
jgi:hypothetical protein